MLMSLDIQKILQELASIRPLFHLEADFQHSLAWEIQQKHQAYSIRFEHMPPRVRERMFLDLWVKDENEIIHAIELKYKKRRLQLQWNEEEYDLSDDAAQDLGRYDFLKDIQRIESVVSNNEKIKGFAIMLTNDSAYWKIPSCKETFGDEFRIHEGVNIHGNLKWRIGASEGTTMGRTDSIMISGSYPVKWQNYSKLSDDGYGTFKYLLVEILSIRT
jgi:hypothetical protein